MILIIAEKPSLAQDIANALPGSPKKTGNEYFTNGDYVITWLYGHILTLKEPEDCDPIYENRQDLALLPISFNPWGMKVSPSEDNSKAKRAALIGELLKKADSVIHAGDPDDEGQLLVDELLRWHRYKGVVQRLDTGNTTKAALQKALKNMKPNADFENAGWAAYARSVADFLVGINLSRYYSAIYKSNLPFGRVKIPTLGLVINRDILIENHKNQTYFEIVGKADISTNKIPVKYYPYKEDTQLVDGRIVSKEYASEKKELMEGLHKNAIVSKEKQSAAPPLPFNLVKLQSYCSTQFGYSPSETLDITQELRTKYHAITYNRSDCQYLSSEHYKEAPATIAQTLSNLGVKGISGLDASRKSKCFNDANITAHFAIIPSGASVDIGHMTEREKNVYLAICKYYLIQFMPNALKEKTKLTIQLSDKGTAESSAIEILSPGYLSLLKSEKAEKESEEANGGKELSAIAAGTYETFVDECEILEKETKPLPRYTKATLNADMTRIAKYVTDPEIKALLLEKDKDKKGENGSIGTSATRATIIDDLIKLGYIREDGKKLISTDRGRAYYSIIPDGFRKADMTALWWVEQEDIKKGTKRPQDLADSVLEEVKKLLATPVKPLEGMPTSVAMSGEVIGSCPVCKSSVTASSRGFFKCVSPECKFIFWEKPKSSLFEKTKITKAQAKQLLEGKRVTFTKLYSSKKKTTFAGMLALEKDSTSPFGAKLQLYMDSDESLGTCPRCGGDITETPYVFQCSNRDCKYIFWKKQKQSLLSKLTITASMAKKLIAGQKVTTKFLYSQAKNKTFEGKLYLDDSAQSNYGPAVKVEFMNYKK